MGGEEELDSPLEGGDDEDKPYEDSDDDKDIDELSKESKADIKVEVGTKVELVDEDVRRPHEDL